MSRQKKFNIFVITCFGLVSVSIMGIFGYSYFYFSQMQDNINEAKLKTAAYEAKEDILAQLEIDYKKIESDLPELSIALPPQKEASKLIKDLEVLANQNGLALLSFRATAGSKTTTDLNLTQTVKGKYSYELPLELNLEGDYGNFVGFIKKLENYKRLNNVSGFIVNNVSEDGTGNEVNVKLKITVFLDR